MRRVNGWLVAVLCMVAAALMRSPASGQMRQRGGFAAGSGDGSDRPVNLPYRTSDGSGGMWMIYNGGWIQQNVSGMGPIIGQGEMLTINGNNQMNNGNNTAQIDGKTGELVLGEMPSGECTVTRRILFSKTDGMVRFIDIVKNTSNHAQNVSYSLQTIINFGVADSTTVADPKRKDNQIGWVGQVANGMTRAVVEIYGGQGAKNVPAIHYQQGNNVVEAGMQLAIPAGKSVAVMHFLTTADSLGKGKDLILGLKDSKVMHSLPNEIRRAIVNFRGANFDIGDYEILRGEAFDVVELRSGDEMQGTLQEKSYKLKTFYGDIELKNDQVVSIINVGQYHPRQLLVTSDGQFFGGQLQKDTIGLELSSGQVVQVPLSQISRVGYHMRPGEPEDWTYDKPCMMMRTGDRVFVDMPKGPINVDTRYGMLKLDPQVIASIAFVSEDTGVHEISLTDGSKFAGLIDTAQLKMTLSGSGTAVEFPASSVYRLQLQGQSDDVGPNTPSLTLSNHDVLVGTINGQLKLDTSFSAVDMNGPEIKHIVHTAAESQDVQVTLWDNTTLSGQLEERDLECKLNCGTSIEVPVWLLADYTQPLPQPSGAVLVKIRALVAQLSADDWKQRDEAEATLVQMGPPIIGALQLLLPDQPPEGQQRISAIIKQLGGTVSPSSAKPAEKPAADNDGPAGAGAVNEVVKQLPPAPVVGPPQHAR